MKKVCVFVAVMVLMVIAGPVRSQESASQTPDFKGVFLDTAFEQYVNPKLFEECLQSLSPALLTDVALQLAEGERVLLRTCDGLTADQMARFAVDAADPALMTDLALQLIEGERILLRSHRAISAENMLKAAAKAAAVKGDKESEARIKKVAEATGKTALVADLNAVAQMAVASRSSQQPPKFTTDGNQELDKELASIVVSINDAVLFQNKGLLDEMEKTVKADKSLPEKVAAELAAFIAKSKSTLPEKVDPASAALVKLAGASRQHGGGGSNNASGNSGPILQVCKPIEDPHQNGGMGGAPFYSSRLRATFMIVPSGGRSIAGLMWGSPLRNAGLEVGDIIVSMDGIPVHSDWELNNHYSWTIIDLIDWRTGNTVRRKVFIP